MPQPTDHSALNPEQQEFLDTSLSQMADMFINAARASNVSYYTERGLPVPDEDPEKVAATKDRMVTAVAPLLSDAVAHMNPVTLAQMRDRLAETFDPEN